MSIILRSGSSTNTLAINADGSMKAAAQITSSTGAVAGFRPDGNLRVANDPTSLFHDSFESFDTVNNWTVTGTAPAVTVGQATLAAGTTAGAVTLMRTVPGFPSMSSSYVQAGAVLSLDTAVIVGNKRLWGLGFPAATPTAAAPLSSGVVFEVSDADGQLYGAVYAAGARVKSLALTRPADGAMHRYVLYYRTSKVYFEIDGVSVGSIDNPNPSVSSMPVVLGSINAGALTVAATMTVTVVGVADTSRNNLQISDATYPFRKVQVGRSGGLSVKGALPAAATTTIATGATGTLGPVDVTEAGNVSFIVKNAVAGTPWVGSPVIVFEQSDDAVSWAPLMAVRADTAQVAASHLLGPGTANTSLIFDAALEGVQYVRARLTAPTAAGALTLVAQPGGMPFSPAVALLQPARTPVMLYGTGMAVGTSGTETLLTLSQQKGTAATTTGTGYTIPYGRKLKVQTLVCTQVGNSTAAAASTVFRWRWAQAGSVSTASTPILLQHRLAAPATATSFQQLALTIPGDGLEITGDGSASFGFTVTATYATNAPTVDLQLIGYEY